MKRISVLFLVFISISLFGCSVPKTDSASIKQSGFYFDTVISIELYHTEDEEILNQCFSLCRKYENYFSRTIEDSDVYKINHSKGTPVQVHKETLELLTLAMSFSEQTNHLFTPAIAPLKELWNLGSEDFSLPSPEQINTAIGIVQNTEIMIDYTESTVTLSSPMSGIDLGGIAKGYIADKLKEYLVSEDVTAALINLGGNILTIGQKSDTSPWLIGIQMPFGEHSETIASLRVADKSIVSSGIYERYKIIEKTLYHHILNPSTGYPVENNLLGVTIISDSSATGDALSTSCFLLGESDGMELIENTPDVEAIFVTKDYELLYSSGAKAYFNAE